MASEEGSLDIVRALIRAGADTNAAMIALQEDNEDSDEETTMFVTPISIARGKGYTDIVEELQNHGI